MAARYALGSMWVHNSVSGADEFIHQGALRDSASQAVIENPSGFQSAPLAAGTQMHPRLAGYLAQYPAGP
jgi:hypothetical protein